MAASSRLSKLIRSLIAGFLVVALLSVASAQSVAPRAVQVDAVTESVMGRAPIVTMAVENVTRPGEAPLVGESLRASATTSDPDGDAITATSYRWLRGGTEIASTNTYTVVDADRGLTLSIEAIATTDSAITDPASGTGSTTIAITANTAPTATPTITGTLQAGQTLTANAGYADADNDPPGTHAYQWYRSDVAGGSPRTQIAGATAATYVSVATDLDKYLVVGVVPVSTVAPTTGVEAFGVTSAAIAGSAPVAANVAITGQTWPNGQARFGWVQTGSYNFTDAENDPDQSTLQWYRADNAAGTGKTRIDSATAATYTPTFADDGKYLFFEVTPISPNAPTTGTAMSAVRKVDSRPVASAVAISGTVAIGQVLTGAHAFNDADNDTEDGTLLKWYRASDASGSDKAAIAGAASSTYTVQAADSGKVLFFEVTPGTHAGQVRGQAVLSAGTVQIVNTPPEAYGLAISGQTWANGQAKFGWAQTGSYSYRDADNDAQSGSTPAWYLADDAAGTNEALIASATGWSYTPTAADDGKFLVFKVTPRAATGVVDGTTVSVARKIDSRPVASNVDFSGTGLVGSVLTGSHAFTDADNDSEDGTSFKWYRADDAAGTGKTQIAGATATTYTVTASDTAKFLFFEVTPKAHAGNVSGAAVLSAGKRMQSPPEAYDLAISGQTWANGQAKFGWAQTGSYSYRDADNDAQSGSTPAWYLADDAAGTNETLIVAATGWSYTPTAADDGKFLVFKVTPRAATGVVDGTTVSVARKIDSRPVVTGVDYTGTQSVGQTLTVSSYGFTDADNDAQEGTIVTWFRADGADGVGRTQAGTGTTYVVQSADAAKYIIVEVTPGTHGGNVLGVPQSNWGKQVQEPPPTANPSISGPILLGETLTGNVGYAHPGNAPQGTHSYQWFRADNAAGTSNKTAIANATNATYVPTEAVVGKTLVFQVTPRTSSGTAGQAASVVSSRWVFKHYGNNNWTDNEYFSGSVDKTFTVSGRSGNAHTKSYVTWDISFGGYRQFYRLDLVAPDGTLYNLMPFGTSGPSFMQGAVDLDLSSEALNGTWRLRVSNNLPTGNGTIDFHQVSVFF